MTSTISPADTGDIRTDVGENTQPLGSYYRPEWPVVLRRPALMPPQPGQPQPHPPTPIPIPQPTPHLGDAQPIAPLERVVDETAVVDLLAALGGRPDRRSVRSAIPTTGPRLHRGRHRAPAPWWTHQLIGAGTALTALAAVVAALLAVR